jgi:hypothetical protein
MHCACCLTRCRTRLAYEILGLIKRLWGGNVTVVVSPSSLTAATGWD